MTLKEAVQATPEEQNPSGFPSSLLVSMLSVLFAILKPLPLLFSDERLYILNNVLALFVKKCGQLLEHRQCRLLLWLLRRDHG